MTDQLAQVSAHSASTEAPALIPHQYGGPSLTLPADTNPAIRELINQLEEPLRTAVIACINTPDGVRITMGNAKGGVMKTTLAVYISLILSLTGEPVLLVDADDTNRTCLKWQAAAGDAWPSSVNVVSYSGPGMAKQVNDLMQRGYRHLVIDVGPTDKGVLKTAWMLTKRGIVPTQQHVGDIVQLTTTFQLLKEMGETIDLKVLIARSFPKRVSYSNGQDHISDVIEGKTADHPDGLPTVSLLENTVPFLEGIADTWGTVPEDFAYFGAVLAETLGVPASVIAERESREAAEA
ncbi:Cobyrinic acid ac-diamide synthase [Actinobacteria bacterium OK006]|nr:Cobyrinic acid ac-diamide synthase [Actinobacteria bacterium OK006]